MDLLPADVADRIIDIIVEDDRFPRDYIGHLVPICRTWRDSIERKLYAKITLNLSTDEGRTVYKLLCRTLDETPRLGKYVKRLDVEFLTSMETTEVRLDILGLCPDLCHFVFWGYLPLDLPLPIGTLSQLDLQTFDVTYHPHCDKAPSAEIGQVIQLLQCWPKIKKFNIKMYNYGDLPIGKYPLLETMSLSRPPSTCSSLRELELDEACPVSASGFKALYLLNLSQLENFSAHIEATEEAYTALLECFNSWATHLKVLRLSSETYRLDDSSKTLFSQAMRRFRRLTLVDIRASMLDPDTLLSISTLSQIYYWNADEECFRALVAGLEAKDTDSQGGKWKNVPELRSLVLSAYTGGSVQREQLETVRRDRDISMGFQDLGLA